MPGIGDSVDRRLTGRDDSRFGSRHSTNGKTIDIPAGIREEMARKESWILLRFAGKGGMVGGG